MLIERLHEKYLLYPLLHPLRFKHLQRELQEFGITLPSDNEVTVSQEVEFYLLAESIEDLEDDEKLSKVVEILRDLNLHLDYYHTYEINLPPVRLLKKDSVVKVISEAIKLVEEIGLPYISEYYDRSEGVYRGVGAHVHIRLPKNPTLWTKFINWATVVTPLLAPLISVSVRYKYGRTYTCRTSSEYFFRLASTHYCIPPLRVNKELVKRILEREGYLRFRGYIPIPNDNQWFAVEINAYRKVDLTIELRVPENHFITGLAYAEVIYKLAEKFSSPKISRESYEDLWRTYVYDATYGTPRDVSDYVRIKVERDVSKLLSSKMSPVEFCNQLLDVLELSSWTKELINTIACGRAVSRSLAYEVFSKYF